MSDFPEYQIVINSLSLYGYHGVLVEENKLGQTFLIDLTLQVRSSKPTIDDNPENILSYVDVVDQIETVFSSRAFRLLESLAETILEELGRFQEIQQATICIRKPNPPIPQPLDSIGVSFEKSY